MNTNVVLSSAYTANIANQHASSVFNGARTAARVQGMAARVFGRSQRLQALPGARQGETVAQSNSGPGTRQSEMHVQSVPIASITGSLGRTHDFDRAFRPLHTRSFSRWASIDRAFHAGAPLPPVELIVRNGKYYVVDGHHRISVAHLHGQQFIDAVVTALP